MKLKSLVFLRSVGLGVSEECAVFVFLVAKLGSGGC